MRDFRAIRKFDLEWKDAQDKIQDAKSQLNGGPPSGGGDAGLGGALGNYLEELGESGYY